jgi:hypothetical protein
LETTKNKKKQWIGTVWQTDFSLSVLLVLIMISVFGLYPIAHKNLISETLFFLFVSLTFMVGIFSITYKIKERLITVSFTMLLFTTYLIVQRMDSEIADAIMLGLIIAYLSVLAVLLLKLIFSDNRPNIHRLQGAVAVYILYALIFSFAFRLNFLLNPEALQFKNLPHGTTHVDPFEYMYFSFQILTTMGYGEIVPLGHVAQSLAMIEALSGVLFPSVLIARIVSLSDLFKKK